MTRQKSWLEDGSVLCLCIATSRRHPTYRSSVCKYQRVRYDSEARGVDIFSDIFISLQRFLRQNSTKRPDQLTIKIQEILSYIIIYISTHLVNNIIWFENVAEPLTNFPSFVNE